MHYFTEISPLIKEIELRQQPVIITVNEFTEESVIKFNERMCHAQNSGQQVIPIEIDSFGGQAYSLMAMISSIKASRVPVATIVHGKAMSCGAILASFGSEGLRFMDKDATMMIHDVSSFAFGKIEELKSDVREAERLNKILLPLHHSMFIESNPSPVKYAAKQLGLCDDSVRLPLVKVTEQTKSIINKALKSTKLL